MTKTAKCVERGFQMCSIDLSRLTSPHRRLLVPGSTGLLDTKPTASAEDPDGPKLFTSLCRDLPFPGMCTPGTLLTWVHCEHREANVLNIPMEYSDGRVTSVLITLRTSEEGFELKVWQRMGEMGVKCFHVKK